jgi:hypothetical protein
VQTPADVCHLGDDFAGLVRCGEAGHGASVPPHHLGAVTLIGIRGGPDRGDDTARRLPTFEDVLRAGGHAELDSEYRQHLAAGAGQRVGELFVAVAVVGDPRGFHFDNAER